MSDSQQHSERDRILNAIRYAPPAIAATAAQDFLNLFEQLEVQQRYIEGFCRELSLDPAEVASFFDDSHYLGGPYGWEDKFIPSPRSTVDQARSYLEEIGEFPANRETADLIRELIEHYNAAEADGADSQVKIIELKEQLEAAQLHHQHAVTKIHLVEGRANGAEHQADVMRDVLTRLRQWDVLNLPTGSGDDGPYWRGEIDRALSYPASEPKT